MNDPRELYFNGQFIGEVPNTGDYTKDTEATIALMKAKGVHREITPEQAIFRQAVSFATTAAYLHKRDLATAPWNAMSIVPFVVNAAFALELYLKTANLLFGEQARGHDLLDLFDALPISARDTIFANFAKSTWPCDIADMVAFRSAIERLRHAFVQWRYLHESNRAAEIRFPELIFLMEVLHETCRSDIRLQASTSDAASPG
jgi:hypothetical protein